MSKTMRRGRDVGATANRGALGSQLAGTDAARRGRLSRFWSAATLLPAVSLALGCAPMQRVPLVVDPPDAAVYLDGEQLGSLPAELELRSDRDHKLFFKRPGYRSELIVLESVRASDRERLEPAEVRVRLRSESPGGRKVQVETEGEGAARIEPR